MVVDIVSIVVDFTDGEEMVKLVDKIIPIHIEYTVVAVFVISKLHALLLLGIN